MRKFMLALALAVLAIPLFAASYSHVQAPLRFQPRPFRASRDAHLIDDEAVAKMGHPGTLPAIFEILGC